MAGRSGNTCIYGTACFYQFSLIRKLGVNSIKKLVEQLFSTNRLRKRQIVVWSGASSSKENPVKRAKEIRSCKAYAISSTLILNHDCNRSTLNMTRAGQVLSPVAFSSLHPVFLEQSLYAVPFEHRINCTRENSDASVAARWRNPPIQMCQSCAPLCASVRKALMAEHTVCQIKTTC